MTMVVVMVVGGVRKGEGWERERFPEQSVKVNRDDTAVAVKTPI